VVTFPNINLQLLKSYIWWSWW